MMPRQKSGSESLEMSRVIFKYWNLSDNDKLTVYRVRYDDYGETTVTVNKNTKDYSLDGSCEVPPDDQYHTVYPIFKAAERDVPLPQGVVIGCG